MGNLEKMVKCIHILSALKQSFKNIFIIFQSLLVCVCECVCVTV